MKTLAKMKVGTEQTMKLAWLYKVVSQSEFNSWTDSSFTLLGFYQTSNANFEKDVVRNIIF